MAFFFNYNKPLDLGAFSVTTISWIFLYLGHEACGGLLGCKMILEASRSAEAISASSGRPSHKDSENSKWSGNLSISSRGSVTPISKQPIEACQQF